MCKKYSISKNEEMLMYNSYLNQTIAFASKEYFRRELEKRRKEINLGNDELKYLKEKDAQYEEKFFIDAVQKNVIGFINCCDNLELNYALKSLTAIEQEVIFLLFSEDLSQSEAADILKICSKSVSRIKMRAFDKLRKYLKGRD